MITSELREQVASVWRDENFRLGIAQLREEGATPHRVALELAEAISYGLGQEDTLAKSHPHIDYLAFKAALEAGEFDQEIAAILGYM